MNLLPNTEKEALRKGFKLRSLILGSLSVSVFFLVGIVMLLPSYFLASGNFSKAVSENSLYDTEDEVSAVELLDLPEEINAKLKFLQTENNAVSSVEAIFEVIKYLPAGVKINSVLFERNKVREDKNGVTILVSGLALDRDSLISFSNLLKKSNFFSTVDLPVSSLTKDKNLPFSVNIFIEN